jgi:hypothetical protein
MSFERRFRGFSPLCFHPLKYLLFERGTLAVENVEDRTLRGKVALTLSDCFGQNRL